MNDFNWIWLTAEINSVTVEASGNISVPFASPMSMDLGML
jgi:hypothetical protein